MKIQQINIKNKKTNIKNILMFWIYVFFLFFLFISIIIISIFKTDQFINSYKLGMPYSGGYKINIDVFNTIDNDYDPMIPNGDNTKGLNILKNKLDPLNNSNLYLKTLGKNSLELTIGKNNFVSFNLLKKTIQRLGAIYLITKDGTDLLINNNERIILNDIISKAQSEIDINRKPLITLKINNKEKWDNIVNKVISQKNNNINHIYIWTDIGQFIDDLRHNIENIALITRNFQTQIIDKIHDNNIQKNIRSIFNVKYKDIHSGGQLKHNNLLTMGLNLPLSSLKKIMKDNSFQFTDVDLNNLIIDPNKKNDITNIYIDPLKPYLIKILDWSTEINHKYSHFLLNFNSLKGKLPTSKFTNQIYTLTETEAISISNLINGGLNGIKFIIKNYTFIKPTILQKNFKNLIIILKILFVTILIFLIFCYRLFGIITILMLLTTIISILYFSTLLRIQISPEMIIIIIMIIGLMLKNHLLLFSHYKHEKYINNISYEPAIKIANKKNIIYLLDIFVILLIFGLSLYWFGVHHIKIISSILLISTIISFIFIFIISKLIYFIFIKLKIQLNIKWLDIPKCIFFNFIKKQSRIYNNIYIFLKKITNNKYILLIYNNLSKIILFICLIIFIISLYMLLNKQININSTINIGTNISIYSNYWQTQNSKTEINFINKTLENFQKISKYYFIYQIDIFTSEIKNQGNQILIISTNISKNIIVKKFIIYISEILSIMPDDLEYINETTKPLMGWYILKMTIINILTGITFIFIYTLFRFSWSQIISILISLILILLMTFFILIIFKITITFEIILSFIFVCIFALIFLLITIINIKQNKKNINFQIYNTFFEKIIKFKNQIKLLKKTYKQFQHQEYNKFILIKYHLYKKNIKENIKKEIKNFLNKREKIKKINKLKIINIQKEIKNYYEYNKFFKIFFNQIIHKLIINYLILGIIFIFGLLILLIFNINLFNFIITIIIGIVLIILITLFITTKIWIILEKIQELNKLKIKQYLNY